MYERNYELFIPKLLIQTHVWLGKTRAGLTLIG